jgi:hypothetical protein
MSMLKVRLKSECIPDWHQGAAATLGQIEDSSIEVRAMPEQVRSREPTPTSSPQPLKSTSIYPDPAWRTFSLDFLPARSAWN